MTSMRRILWCAAACAFVVLIARGQDEKVDFDKCPQKVKDAVMARFPGAKITASSKTIENGAVPELQRKGFDAPPPATVSLRSCG